MVLRLALVLGFDVEVWAWRATLNREFSNMQVGMRAKKLTSI